MMRPLASIFGATVVFLLVAAVAQAASFRLLASGKELPDGQVSALAVFQGMLCVGSSGQGITLFETATGKTRIFTQADGLPSNTIASLAIYKGRLYAGTSAGIASFDGTKWSAITEAGGLPMRNVVLSASPDGKSLWATSVFLSGGTVRYDGKEWRFMGGQGRGLFNNITAYGYLDDAVLMGASQGTIYIRKGEEVDSLKKGFPPANVLAVSTRGGSIYMGTNLGLYVWRGKEWEPYDLPSPDNRVAVFSLLRIDRDLVVGTLRGLVVIDGQGVGRILSNVEGFPAGAVISIAEAEGTLYAATDRGVAILKGWR